MIYGGRRDVDVVARVDGREVFRELRSTEFRREVTGERGTLEVCFGNEFSTVAHKTVYFALVVGDGDDGLAAAAAKGKTGAGGDGAHVLTQLESSSHGVHQALDTVINLQTHHRMREATHRYTMEAVHERVQLVSACETAVLILVSVAQVLYLRSLFREPARF